MTKKNLTTLLILSTILLLVILTFIPKKSELEGKSTQEKAVIKPKVVKKKKPNKDGIDSQVQQAFDYSQANYGVSPFVQEITDFGDPKEFFQRNLNISELKEIDLSKQDKRALHTFLKQSPPTAGAHLALHSLKNDIITHLIFEEEPDVELGRVLTAIMLDKTQHQVMREYAAQFVLNYFEQSWPYQDENTTLSDQDGLVREELKEALWQLTELRQGSMAGTAISKLHEISVNYADIDKEKVAERAYEIAKDTSTEVASRMGALDILIKYPNEEAREDIKAIAMDDAQSPSMRMVAIASYSSVRSDDGEFNDALRKIVSTNKDEIDKRLKWAAEGALKKIKKL